MPVSLGFGGIWNVGKHISLGIQRPFFHEKRGFFGIFLSMEKKL
jgi:hypothetical protein